jgi:hypothetical protein
MAQASQPNNGPSVSIGQDVQRLSAHPAAGKTVIKRIYVSGQLEYSSIVVQTNLI